MPQSTFSSINSIIERDKVDTPYKYSLLRAVIESCQEFPQFAKEGEGEFAGRIVLPVGLLVVKWLIYYYPFFEGEFVVLKIGERPGHRELAFRRRFEELTAFYAGRGGFSVFYDDLVSGSVPGEIMPVFASISGITLGGNWISSEFSVHLYGTYDPVDNIKALISLEVSKQR